MRRQQTGQPVWDLSFDEKGNLTAPGREELVREVQSEGPADLFVFSHGWGTSEDNARSLYDALFPMIATAATGVSGIGTIGFAGVYWPSLWFPESEQATSPARTGSTQGGDAGVVDASAGTAALTGAEIARSLVVGFTDPAQQERIVEIGQLIDEGAAMSPGTGNDTKQRHVARIHQLLQTLVPAVSPGSSFEDLGEGALLGAADPKSAYQAIAEAFGSVPVGSSEQGLGDWFKNAINGAKDAVRVLSYTIMKARAGDIGQQGLGPLLADLHERVPGIRVHLIGHSFGARLVAFALAGVGAPAESPVASLLLLQGAFSHWSFAHATDNPFGKPGGLNAVKDRVHGPLVATFTPLDWAVGVWYPRASFLAQQDIAGTVAGRWGAMGADGFQAVNPVEARTMPAGGGLEYNFATGSFYCVEASNVINDTTNQPFAGAHSDIRKLAVAQLAVAAAAPSPP